MEIIISDLERLTIGLIVLLFWVGALSFWLIINSIRIDNLKDKLKK